MKSVLFVAYGGGHIRTLLPVVQEIERNPELRGLMQPIVLALTTARGVAESMGVASIGFRELAELTPAEAEWGRRLLGSQTSGGAVSQDESIAYLGRSYCDLINTEGFEQAERLYAELGRAAFFPINTALRALDELEVDAVVATNSPRAERAFLEAARRSGRKSLGIWSSLATHEIEWMGQPGFTTKVCVDGPTAEATLIRAGRRADEVVVTGNPQFDDLRARRGDPAVQMLRADKGWAPEDVVMLFAQQNEPAVHPFTGERGDPLLPERLNEALLASLDGAPESVKICVRYHPNQEPLALPLSSRVSLSPPDEDLATLVHAVDGVFTCSSTVGYQAALVGKPVVQGMFSVFSAEVPLDEIAGARRVSEFSEFASLWESFADGGLMPPPFAADSPRSAAANVVELLREEVAR